MRTAWTGSSARAVDRFGRLDVMMCNAGFGIAGAIDEITAAQTQKLMEVNYTGTYPRRPGRARRVSAAASRPHHHRLVDRRQARRAVHGGLRGHEVCAGGSRGMPALGARWHGHPRQRGVSGLDRHGVLRRDVTRDRHDRRARARPEAGCRRRSPTRSRAPSSVRCPRCIRLFKSRALVWLNVFAPGLCDRVVQRFGRKPLQRERR